MSVLTLIREPEARARFDAVLPKRFAKIAKPCRVPSRAGNPRLIGTAFDYALRTELMRACPHAEHSPWVAEMAVLHLLLSRRETEKVASVQSVVRRAREFARSYTQLEQPSRDDRIELAWHTMRLARIDVLYRAPHAAADPLEEPTPEQAREVADLLEIAPIDQLAHPTCLLLNPTFGEWSGAVGGADADLISGNRLIDFKTLRDPAINRADVRQLLAYFLLAIFAKRDGAALPSLESLELYSVRYGAFFTLPTAEIVSAPAFPQTEEWFRARFAERAKEIARDVAELCKSRASRLNKIAARRAAP